MSRANDMVYPAPQTDTPNNTLQCGLTVREFFAAMAMQGILSCWRDFGNDNNAEGRAETAVRHADALIAELAKTGGSTS